MWLRSLGLALVVLGGASAAFAGEIDKPLERTEIDKRAARTAHDASLFGTDLFNKGNYEGCFRLYQGVLAAIQPMLDHRPKLVELIKDRLEKAVDMKASAGAFVLREALDAVQKETSEALLPPKKSLWDRLGSEKAVRLVIRDFLVAALKDPKVNFTRDGKYKLDEKGMARLEELLVEMVSAGTGGPLKYTGRDMRSTHKGMRITEDEFNALVGVFLASLKKHDVAQIEMAELIEILGSTKKEIVGQ